MRPVWRLLGASGDGQPVHSQCYRVQQLLQSATALLARLLLLAKGGSRYFQPVLPAVVQQKDD